MYCPTPLLPYFPYQSFSLYSSFLTLFSISWTYLSHLSHCISSDVFHRIFIPPNQAFLEHAQFRRAWLTVFGFPHDGHIGDTSTPCLVNSALTDTARCVAFQMKVFTFGMDFLPQIRFHFFAYIWCWPSSMVYLFRIYSSDRAFLCGFSYLMVYLFRFCHPIHSSRPK